MIGLSLLNRMFSEETVEFTRIKCLRERCKDSQCELCFKYCPQGAVNLNPQPAFDSAKCNKCGICVALCPTEAFSHTAPVYERWLAAAHGKKKVVFSCASELGGDKIKVPCIGSLSSAVMVAVASSGSESVSLDTGPCQNCTFHRGKEVALELAERANGILDVFGAKTRIIASVEASELRETPRQKEYSRRELFSIFRKSASDVVTQTTSQPSLATIPQNMTKKSFLLLNSLKALGIPGKEVPTADLPFADVRIEQSCNGCGICAALCPSAALRTFDGEEHWELTFSMTHCIKCDVCTVICPQKSLSYAPMLNLSHLLLNEKPQSLVRLEKAICPECERSYVATGYTKRCPSCQKQQELLDSFFG